MNCAAARAYDSASGHGHDAAPAGNPHPPRATSPLPGPAIPALAGAIVRSGLPRPERACGAPMRALRPLTRVFPAARKGQPSPPGLTCPRPETAHPASDQDPQTISTHPRQLQSLGGQLHQLSSGTLLIP